MSMDMANRYIGTGVFKCELDGGIMIEKRVNYDITTPLWSSGGFCIEFLDNLTVRERRMFGLLEGENEFEVGDGILDINWTIYNEHGQVVLNNQGDYSL
jgi:hypothetical protein